MRLLSYRGVASAASRQRTFACCAVPLVAALTSFSAGAQAAGPAASEEEGRRVFLQGAQPSCAVCHTLSDAGAAGNIGPNLDELKPDAARVRRAVKEGIGGMPPFGETLTDAQINAVAQYVARAAGGG